MAPVTGEAMADLLSGGGTEALAPFDPGRFRW
jgi:glycine/D-amino acid oxidase-like deaminating enzyme